MAAVFARECEVLREFTQAELARRSGVSLRSIQMYEQRNKDINKAGAEALYRLSKVFGCSMEDLPEK
jgi:transcriptional regulator with XRE-family HTH domain